jgi:hypothetical protein
MQELRASALASPVTTIQAMPAPPKKHRLFATTFSLPFLKKKVCESGINQPDKKDNFSSGVIKVKPSGFLKKSPPSYLG